LSCSLQLVFPDDGEGVARLKSELTLRWCVLKMYYTYFLLTKQRTLMGVGESKGEQAYQTYILLVNEC